mmetsp:Transcript_80580/g.176731  ORF Transcript_80580/g.176731 Transcript_80580/m.176731 type:complete len:81 (-) Transcript_80580:71-313(-)
MPALVFPSSLPDFVYLLSLSLSLSLSLFLFSPIPLACTLCIYSPVLSQRVAVKLQVFSSSPIYSQRSVLLPTLATDPCSA